MSGNSWVTLATNDSYSLGALVLALSLKRAGTVHSLTVLVTPGVSSSMRNQLSSVFNIVQEVNILDSKDEKNLALLTRPELGVTFTKIHCWRLTQFSKCVFLDADVLVLRNCDELFDREELSAAPDVGWPDCFNSGVFVYRPSIETYNAIINLALSQGSFDGGDQGLLNQYFSDWATKDISRHLPFIYNMCSSATYSYLPAFKQFGKDIKIVHFIGSSKPWLQYLDSETRQVRPAFGSEHLQALLQLWWDIFCNDIHSKLSQDMAGLAGALSQLTLGVPRSAEQLALEEHLRKQAWEHGNIDYMGRDSFDNIWQKICQTLAEPVPDPLPEVHEQPSQVSSVVDNTSQQVTSAGNAILPSSQQLQNIATESKEICNITSMSISQSPDLNMDIVPETSLREVELNNALVKTEDASNLISLDPRISGCLKSSDTSMPESLPVSQITTDIGDKIIPEDSNSINVTEKFSDIVPPDTGISDPQDIKVLSLSDSPLLCSITKTDIVSDTMFSDNSISKDATITNVTEKVSDIIPPDTKISDPQEMKDLSLSESPLLSSITKTDIVSDTVVSDNSISKDDTISNITEKVSDIIPPDTKISDPQEIKDLSLSESIPLPSITTMDIIVDPLKCGDSIVSDTMVNDNSISKDGTITNVTEKVSDVIPPDTKISDPQDIKELSSSDSPLLSSITKTDIVSDTVVNDNSISEDGTITNVTEKVSDVIPPDTKISDPQGIKDLFLPDSIPLPSLTTMDIIVDPLKCGDSNVSEGVIPPVALDRIGTTLSDPKIPEYEEKSDVSFKSSTSLSPNKTEIVDKDIAYVPKLESDSAPKEEIANIASPVALITDKTNSSLSDSSLGLCAVSGLPPTSDITNQTETSLPPYKTDQPSFHELTATTPVTSDLRLETESLNEEDAIANVSDSTSNLPEHPNGFKVVCENQTLSRDSRVLEIPPEENKSYNTDTDVALQSVNVIDTDVALQSVNVIEPTPPTSPSDSLPQTVSPNDSNILNIDASIPDTPPVVPQSSELSEDQSNLSSASISSPVQESSASPETVDPQAPVPPKRRHRPSQKTQKGKK